MKSMRWIAACALVALGLASVMAFAGEDGQGHGKGKQKGKSEMEYRYSDHDREAMRGWYHERRGNLPRGLAKRDRLPPGLERQLVMRGTLPPGLRRQMRSCPPDLVRMLPPPPPDCRHVLIGGNIVLLNRRTFMVLDIFHFEL